MVTDSRPAAEPGADGAGDQQVSGLSPLVGSIGIRPAGLCIEPAAAGPVTEHDYLVDRRLGLFDSPGLEEGLPRSPDGRPRSPICLTAWIVVHGSCRTTDLTRTVDRRRLVRARLHAPTPPSPSLVAIRRSGSRCPASSRGTEVSVDSSASLRGGSRAGRYTDIGNLADPRFSGGTSGRGCG